MLSLLMSMFFLIPLILKINIYVLLIFFFFLTTYFIMMFSWNNFFVYISMNMGLDYYSFFMVILTFWLFILMIYGLLNLKNLYFSYLSGLVVLMVIFLVLCFLTLDFFTFYIYFECSVLPVFLLIYGWGYQPERVFSSLYFFIYTLMSSLPLFLLILKLNVFLGYFYFGIDYTSNNFFVFFFFIFSFLVKLPMFFFHLWLPSAHVEAPTSGSMILAGVMLKLGGYGLVRVFYMFTNLISMYSYIFVSLSLLGSLYVSLFCLLQSDLSVLVAYSSVSHMGLVICGLMTLTMYGFVGSLYLMVSHGLVSSGLFYLVGCMYDRLGTRSIFLMRGLINIFPSFMMFFFFLIISNMSCPPSLNLVSEIFICFSLLSWGNLTLLLIIFSLFFSACAMINFFSFICHGMFSGLLMTLDSGLISEFYLGSLHLIPVYMFILNLNFFFM
uniref:NADH-ubiquinone oxidoreductase chain 4 n=1 Tax=Changeondelphax velitchkovskyi TaxID=1291384 RepID=A0A343UJA6_9HEMI|nr:NADH dehydrogenase subunit 4 [Changeondelphax velitchkovskyi]AVC55484.1 NADH dehydrogenase subunit 4 [Changeondelphax velitchkovskyi]